MNDTPQIPTQPPVITLNGQPTTPERLQEIRQDESKRLIEKNPGEWRELQKMHG